MRQLPYTAWDHPTFLIRQVRSEKLADLVISDDAHDVVSALKEKKIIFYSHQ